MTNEAADRLHNILLNQGAKDGVSDSLSLLLDEALAAERVETTVGMLDAQEEVAIATRRVTIDRLKKRLGLDLLDSKGVISFAPGALQKILEEVRT